MLTFCSLYFWFSKGWENEAALQTGLAMVTEVKLENRRSLLVNWMVDANKAPINKLNGQVSDRVSLGVSK